MGGGGGLAARRFGSASGPGNKRMNAFANKLNLGGGGADRLLNIKLKGDEI